MSDSVCIVTFKDNGHIHTVFATKKLGKEYCKQNPEYECENYSVHEDLKI